MAELLVYTYIIINIFISIYYFRKELGVFQFPFLIACVSLTFVSPQLINLLRNGYFQNFDSSVYLLSYNLCNIALAFGFNWGNSSRNDRDYAISFDDGRGFKILVCVFFAIGIVALIMNRGVYKGGFISGTFVIVNFFSSYATVALLLILISRKYGKLQDEIFLFFVLIVILLTVDKIIASGRRASTISLVLMLLYFYLEKNFKIYYKLRLLIPLFFFLGMILNSQIGKYRETAYMSEKSFFNNISSLTFNQNVYVQSMMKGEIYNSFEGMKLVSYYSSFDYGAYNWNGIIKNYVPTALVNPSIKKSLLIKNSSDFIVAYLTRSGSTMTGYFDAYLSFGILGFLKFFFVGWTMGLFWRRRDFSDISLLLYFSLLTPGLHLLTHSSNYLFSNLFFLFVFVLPFLRIQSIRQDID